MKRSRINNRSIRQSAVPDKLVDDLSDDELRTLMVEQGLKAADVQQAAEATFCKRGRSPEEATKLGGKFSECDFVQQLVRPYGHLRERSSTWRQSVRRRKPKADFVCIAS